MLRVFVVLPESEMGGGRRGGIVETDREAKSVKGERGRFGCEGLVSYCVAWRVRSLGEAT